MSDDALARSIAGLHRLLSDEHPVRETLTQIAHFAVQAIPGAEGAGVTMLEQDRPQTVVASADFVRAVDEVQYSLGEGPCLLAVQSGQAQTSGSLGGDARWPRFGPRVGRLGVHSALSLPLVLPGLVVGALNVYASGKQAFDPAAVRIGQLFAVPAAASVRNVEVLARSQRLVTQLTEALVSRSTIDQAIGIIMSRTGTTAVEAFDRLRTTSQAEHTKVSDVALALVLEATRAARARRAPPVD